MCSSSLSKSYYNLYIIHIPRVKYNVLGFVGAFEHPGQKRGAYISCSPT